MKTGIFGLAGAAMALLVSGTPLAAQSDKTIRIGNIQSVSGQFAPYGEEMKPVVDYLIKKINDEGGIKSMGGAKLEVVSADDASQPARTVAEVRRLITEEKVSAILGTMFTPQLLAATQVADEYKVPILGLVSSTSRSPYTFALGVDPKLGYTPAMIGIVESLKNEFNFPIKKIALVFSNYETGQAVNKGLKESFEKLGYTIVAEIPLDSKASDFVPAMLNIRSARPDAIVGLQLYSDILKLQKARFNLRYFDGVYVGNIGFSDSSLWGDLGPEVASATLPKNFFGIAVYVPGVKVGKMAEIAADVEKNGNLKTKFGQYAAFATQGVIILRDALERAGTTDPEKLSKAIFEARFKLGEDKAVLPYLDGISFTEQRMYSNAIPLGTSWAADKTLQVVYPPQFANTKPKP
jgi:ABC-type branched-subunit amino acid transport system substrate-binding protein